jgi:hypothetical protein
MTKTILVIPDSHAHPDHNNDRYEWLANLVLDIKPDHVVDIGDWWDMPSLCSYDKGTRSYEGRRYKKDINAGLDAQQKYFDITRAPKKKLPKHWRTLGNHENRINRAVEQDAILEGTISTADLMSKEYGFEEFGFLQPLYLEGIAFQHYFVSGTMGRPIGGENHAKALITKQFMSCVQGHSHTFDYARRTDASGRKLNGLVTGLYQDYVAPYAASTAKLHDTGVSVLRNVEDGNYDLQWISMAAIKREYGNP